MKLFIAVALMAVSTVQAQDSVRMRTRSPERTFTFSMGPEDFRVDMRRGRLGITVDLRGDAARDTVGARVSGVTPGGAADRAGVQTGDVITRLNGTRLVSDANRSNEEDERSRPGLRLINLASRIEAGDTVRLDVRRESRNLTLTFVADRTDMDMLVERLRVPGGALMRTPFMGEMGAVGAGPRAGGTMRVMVSGHALGSLELVTVTPALASGLGITEGLLVTSIDSGNTLGLLAGDVITSIAGRRPTSPVHAMRILGSYETGEAVSFDVMRQRRRTTVSGRIPEARRGEWRVTPNSFMRMPGHDEHDDMMPSFERMPMMERSLEPMWERSLPRKIMVEGKV